MPDLRDTNPDKLLSTSGAQPDPAPSGDHDHDDHNEEVMLTDSSGKLRLPAYVLIALVIALAAVMLLTVGVLVAFR